MMRKEKRTTKTQELYDFALELVKGGTTQSTQY
jgi:hypothetical protein